MVSVLNLIQTWILRKISVASPIPLSVFGALWSHICPPPKKAPMFRLFFFFRADLPAGDRNTRAAGDLKLVGKKQSKKACYFNIWETPASSMYVASKNALNITGVSSEQEFLKHQHTSHHNNHKETLFTLSIRRSNAAIESSTYISISCNTVYVFSNITTVWNILHHKSMLQSIPKLIPPSNQNSQNHWFEKDSFKRIKDLELKSHPPIWRGPHQNSSMSPNFGIAQDPLKWPNAAPPSIQSLHPRCRPCRHVCHLYLRAKANIAPENVAIPKISSSSNNNWFSGAMSYCIC